MEQAVSQEKVYDRLATDEQIGRTVQALEANGFHTLIVEDGWHARDLLLELVPPGAQVHQASSLTLEQIGVTAAIEQSGCFQAVRPKLRSMDRQTQAGEIRHLGASPDYMVGSVHAVTEDGQVLVASGSGSQLGPYVYGAGQVIWVVGVQKIVKDLNEGLRRIYEHVYPLEDERISRLNGGHSNLNKLLIFNKERPGRITIILVKQALGF